MLNKIKTNLLFYAVFLVASESGIDLLLVDGGGGDGGCVVADGLFNWRICSLPSAVVVAEAAAASVSGGGGGDGIDDGGGTITAGGGAGTCGCGSLYWWSPNHSLCDSRNLIESREIYLFLCKWNTLPFGKVQLTR